MKLARALRAVTVVVAALAASSVVLSQVPKPNRFASNYAYGSGGSIAETATQTFGQVSAVESYDHRGLYDGAEVSVFEQVVSPFYGERFLHCLVDRSALQTSKHGATLSVLVDTSSFQCSNFGFYWTPDGQFVFWPYVGSVLIGGTWRDAQFTQKSTSVTHDIDNVSGVSSRQHCQSDRGFSAQGGFTIGGNAYVFGPFSAAAYQDSVCGSSQK